MEEKINPVELLAIIMINALILGITLAIAVPVQAVTTKAAQKVAAAWKLRAQKAGTLDTEVHTPQWEEPNSTTDRII